MRREGRKQAHLEVLGKFFHLCRLSPRYSISQLLGLMRQSGDLEKAVAERGAVEPLAVAAVPEERLVRRFRDGLDK